MQTLRFSDILAKLDRVVTQSDLDRVKDEIQGHLPLDQFEEENFDVNSAIDEVKRDYIERALSKTDTLYEAAELLGLRSYQVMGNWMKKLGLDK